MKCWISSDELGSTKLCLICWEKETINRFDYETMDKPCSKCQKLCQKEKQKQKTVKELPKK